MLRGAARGVLHCYDHAFVSEVLHPGSNEPVRPGEEGELVITQLWRRASPVLRYRMGDRVRYLGVGQCRCGRAVTALECGTIARYDDMIRVKGINLWTHEVDAHVLACEAVDEFNAEVSFDEHGRERIVLDVEVRGGVAPSTIGAQLESSLRAAFKIGMDVRIVPAGSVERFELKQRRWRDRRSAGMTARGLA